MSYLRTLLLVTAIVFMAGCASTPSDEAYESPLGTWRTKIQTQNGSWLSHGVMTFSSEGKATYTFHNGRILFDEMGDDGKWKGHWVEDTWGSVRCGAETDGSKTWGEAILQFNDTYNKFTGTWDKCGEGSTNAWVGTRS